MKSFLPAIDARRCLGSSRSVAKPVPEAHSERRRGAAERPRLKRSNRGKPTLLHAVDGESAADCGHSSNRCCLRERRAVFWAPFAADGWLPGRKRGSGNITTRCCWRSCVVADNSIWRVPSSTVLRFARWQREKNRPQPHGPAQARQQAPHHRRRARHPARGHPD